MQYSEHAGRKTFASIFFLIFVLSLYLVKFYNYFYKGLFAFHMEIGVGYQVVEEIFLENEKCGLQEIQFLQVVDPWLAVQKNSSYKEMFKIG